MRARQSLRNISNEEVPAVDHHLARREYKQQTGKFGPLGIVKSNVSLLGYTCSGGGV